MINAPETATIREQQLFNGRSFHVFIYNKTESISGLHQHDYYEFTPVSAGRYFQETNSKRVLLERGNFIFIPLDSHCQSFYEFDAARILNAGISKCFFEQHYLSLLPYCSVALQVCQTNDILLACVETVISSLNFRETGLEEFVEMVTFYVTNRLHHHHEEQVISDIPQWLKSTAERMYDKGQFSELALKDMVALSAKSQKYLTRTTQRYYGKTPMQIINEIHINFARKQLEMTDYSVTDIAFETGYSSPSLLIKTFRKLTFFTPKSYRRELAEPNQ